MTRRQVIVETVKAEFPKFSSTALSLASRDYETGVTFTARARELKEAAERATAPHKRRKAGRKKSIRFSCRLAPADAERVKQAIENHGGTVQEILEELLLAWAEKEPLPVGKTGNGSKGGNISDAPASENTKI